MVLGNPQCIQVRLQGVTDQYTSLKTIENHLATFGESHGGHLQVLFRDSRNLGPVIGDWFLLGNISVNEDVPKPINHGYPCCGRYSSLFTNTDHFTVESNDFRLLGEMDSFVALVALFLQWQRQLGII